LAMPRGQSRSTSSPAPVAGASQEQVMEAIWVAAEMRAGASWTHAYKAISVMDEMEARQGA